MNNQPRLAKIKSSTMKTRDILVVDDDTISLLFFRLLLESQGFDVATAPDGTSALEAFESSDFRLMITYFNMPNMDGLELTAKVREQHPNIGVVLITGDGWPNIGGAATEAGISRTFSKPVNSKTFVTAIQTLLHPKIDAEGSNREYQQ